MSALEQEATELKEGITFQAEVIMTAEEAAKAQKALAARNRGREQNRLRMRRMR